MRRLIFDVPRWSIYLHREARGLGPVEKDDSPWRQFEDELFERLYAGAAEPIEDGAKADGLRAWAERVHAACDELPDFERLAGECQGDADAAAMAVETLAADLRPKVDAQEAEANPADLRRALRASCNTAAMAVENLQEAREALEQVALARQPGSSHVDPGQNLNGSPSRALAQRLRHDQRLKRIAELAGRFKRIAAAKHRSKIRHGADEISDVEQGADLGRLLPVELGKLLHPRLRLAMLRDFTERRCLQYQLTGTETLGKGPLVVCLDKSGSMDGQSDIWSTAVALALLDLAYRERRPFALLGFDGGVKYQAIVLVGQPLPEEGLFISCSGGTNIDGVIARGLEIIERHSGSLRKADVVLITDGASSSDNALALRQKAATLGVTILGFGIGVDPASLQPWCDEAHAVADLDRLDDNTADLLFTQ